MRHNTIHPLYTVIITIHGWDSSRLTFYSLSLWLTLLQWKTMLRYKSLIEDDWWISALGIQITGTLWWGWYGAPKPERRNDIFTLAPKYYRCAENESAEMTRAPKNKKITFIFYFLLPKVRNITLTTAYILTTAYVHLSNYLRFIPLTTAYISTTAYVIYKR